jgi:hypothetical protein
MVYLIGYGLEDGFRFNVAILAINVFSYVKSSVLFDSRLWVDFLR